ncbi:MAG: allantoate deiminase [Eubacteriales bacterium]
MKIPKRELENLIDWLSQFGADYNGGISRLLYSQSWLDAQGALKDKFLALGIETDFDEVGNLLGKIKGSQLPEKAILTGSHIDTVISGGKYDGQLGVLGGYLAIKYLLETYGPPKKTIKLVSIAEEEGSRFSTVFWGSKNLIGIADEESVINIEDINQIRFVDAMHQCGFDFKEDNKSELEDVEAFVELHIEQGNTLEMEEKQIGIINGIVGQKRYSISLKGESNHAGTTSMKYRKDVMQVFAKIVTRTIEKAEKLDPMVVTFGKIVVRPNVVNVIPGEALFTMDCRHVDVKILEEFTDEIELDMKKIAKEMGVTIQLNCWMNELPVLMDKTIIDVIEKSCENQEVAYKCMHSGAGHDAQIIGSKIPCGMIFVPSVKGISHAKEEYTSMDDLIKGVEILAETLYRLAYE